MRQWFLISLPVLMAPAAAMPAWAQMAPPACTAPVAPPADMASWARPQTVQAATDAKGAAGVTLTPGQAVSLTLMPTPKVAYPVRPAKPGGSVSYGGLASFTVDRPGTWRVALGAGAWVDVVRNGAAATSTAHGHGPDCTGIRKMVDYDLQPGRYMLLVAANGDAQVTVLVMRLP